MLVAYLTIKGQRCVDIKLEQALGIVRALGRVASAAGDIAALRDAGSIDSHVQQTLMFAARSGRSYDE